MDVYDQPREVHARMLFQYTNYALDFSMQNSPYFPQWNTQRFRKHLKVLRTIFTFFYMNGKKYWFRPNFKLPVFDRFPRFGMF